MTSKKTPTVSLYYINGFEYDCCHATRTISWQQHDRFPTKRSRSRELAGSVPLVVAYYSRYSTQQARICRLLVNAIGTWNPAHFLSDTGNQRLASIRRWWRHTDRFLSFPLQGIIQHRSHLYHGLHPKKSLSKNKIVSSQQTKQRHPSSKQKAQHRDGLHPNRIHNTKHLWVTLK
jgi:hypothetical protein